MGLSNDERGWVMTCLSGIACVFGASIICIDILIRQFPGKKNFRIQDSDAFLSASLSLSFGVMVCLLSFWHIICQIRLTMFSYSQHSTACYRRPRAL